MTQSITRIEIAVTNTWANRFTANAALPESAITPITMPVYAADAPARPWGLRGAVVLLRHEVTEADSGY
ncbi:hypothetical protein [Lacisediminihabitans sp.]|uniref:hypothetical protein n=1 Tax=Lacisediminihabitans sp. TaxID=2787631 RepID=UPI00374D5B73